MNFFLSLILFTSICFATERMASSGEAPDYTNRNLYVAYVGGIIGMAKSDSGYAPVPGFLKQLMERSPAFTSTSLPHYTLVEYSPLMDSSNVNPADWVKIAADISAHYNQYDAFVVIHGTDTLDYTASALSFLLENLNKTVIVTGSQVPMVEPYSDATNNLLGSFLAAAMYPNLPEVMVYFKGQLLRGNRVQKISAMDFAAFDSGAFPALGNWGGSLDLFPEHMLPHPTQPLRVYNQAAPTTIVILLYPGITGDMVRRLIFPPDKSTSVEAVLLLAFGMGNGPDANQEFMKVLAEAHHAGVVLVDGTQCFRGVVDLTHYATGSALAQVGCIGAMDMTPEAAFTKLSWLLGRSDLGTGQTRFDNVRRLMQLNLRGEMQGDYTHESH